MNEARYMNRHERRRLVIRCRRGIASQAEISAAASAEQAAFPWIEWRLTIAELRRQPLTARQRRWAKRHPQAAFKKRHPEAS